jgi:hypothetical protein
MNSITISRLEKLGFVSNGCIHPAYEYKIETPQGILPYSKVAFLHFEKLVFNEELKEYALGNPILYYYNRGKEVTINNPSFLTLEWVISVIRTLN